MQVRRGLQLGLGLGLLLTSAWGCGSSKDSGTSDDAKSATTTTIGGPLRSADQAERDRATTGSVGQVFDLGSGISVTVNSIAFAPRGGALSADVRVDNRSGTGASGPVFEIRCAGSTNGGNWLADSTYDMYGTIPSGSYESGTLNLLLPGDKQVSDSNVPECTEPAVLWMRPNGSKGTPAYIALDPATVASLNAARNST